MKEEQENKIILIPKIEDYIEYMLNTLIKLPRTEKFSMGTEYKKSMYKTLRNVLFINKINRKEKGKETLEEINKIDAEINTQRIFLRIMKKEKWIDTKKFNVAMAKIYEIGKIIGGLAKYYAKDYKKQI
mgnify:FL=1